jgi:hypothetical protein
LREGSGGISYEELIEMFGRMEVGEVEPVHRIGEGEGSGRVLRSLAEGRGELKGGSLLAMLLLFSCLFVVAPGAALGESSPILPNDRILCWGRSFTVGVGAGEDGAYPDHLGRLLGREMEYLLSSLAISGDRGVVDKLNEDKYGIVIYQFRWGDYQMGVPWNTTERDLRTMIRSLQESGAVVVIFEAFPVWDVDGQLTALHYMCFTGTSQEMNNPNYVKVSVGNETRIEKYYEMWGETVVSEIAAEEGAYFIPAYETWDCLDLCSGVLSCCDLPFQTNDILSDYGWHPSGATLTHIHGDLIARDGLHLNAMGNGVFAERVARYLVDWGLGEYKESCEEMAQDLPSLYSAAEERMESIEGLGVALDEPRRMFEMAESLEENGYVYTARWILEEKILPQLPDISMVEVIVAMMSEANATIADARQSGVDDGTIESLEGCLGRAETALGELDLDGTEDFLQSILDTPTWQNISTKFPLAQDVIRRLEEAGDRKALVAKADYDRAVKAFGECDHELALSYLEKILIPEAGCNWFAALLLFGLFRWSGCRRLPS